MTTHHLFINRTRRKKTMKLKQFDECNDQICLVFLSMQSGHYVSSLCRLSVAVTVFVSASASWVWTYTKAFNVRDLYVHGRIVGACD